ncbi:MAG: LysR family transcriptional regulator [Burkholderiaceae bacterium]
MDWDKFRFFLALARGGRLTSAARRLEVDHTTVSRQIQALEKALGASLFSREADGYALTEAGKRLLPHAEAMEQACLAVEQEAPGNREELSGVVRIGATEGFGTAVLAPDLARFAAAHPKLVIDLLAVPKLVNLSRREADIVISLDRPARGSLVVAKLTDYVLRLYASAAYLAGHPPLAARDDLRRHAFVGYVDDLLFSKALHYLDEVCEPERIAWRSTSILAQQQAVIAGAGIAVLPAFLADREPALRQVLPDEIRIVRTFWISMPSEIRHLARMQATWQFVRQAVEARQAVLMGEGASDG